MYIEELKEGESDNRDEESIEDACRGEIGLSYSKRALIVVGSRVLFYPTLLYNVIRNKIQSEFRWWDLVDEFLLLGAVPFPTDVPRLKQIGVEGVITLNEPYETLVPSSLYLAHGIDHLVIPTRDYLFAPSFGDICRAVDFIHKNASCGKTTYVHCKAGRGRSTTIVLCYLVQHRQMSPRAAYEYVKLIRPRILLAASQWQVINKSLKTSRVYSKLHIPEPKADNVQAVQEYYRFKVEKGKQGCLDNPLVKSPTFLVARRPTDFDNKSIVLVTEADLEGYDGSHKSGVVGNDIWAGLSWVYRVQFAGQAALARISCLWFHCHARQEMEAEKLGRKSCLVVDTDQIGSLDVDIHVYRQGW